MLKWTYCECGCHCSSIEVDNKKYNQLYLSKYYNIRENTMYLFSGHGAAGKLLCRSQDPEEIDKVAREYLQKELEVYQNQVNYFKKILKD